MQGQGDNSESEEEQNLSDLSASSVISHTEEDAYNFAVQFIKSQYNMYQFILSENADVSVADREANKFVIEYPLMTMEELEDYTDKMQLMFYTYLRNTYLPLKGRIQALHALGAMRTPKAIELLRIGLEDESCIMRLETVKLLGDSLLDEAVPILGSVLGKQKEHYLVRVRAVESLICIGKPECSVLLSNNVEDREEAVQEACVNGLERLDHARRNGVNQDEESPHLHQKEILLPEKLEKLSLNDIKESELSFQQHSSLEKFFPNNALTTNLELPQFGRKSAKEMSRGSTTININSPQKMNKSSLVYSVDSSEFLVLTKKKVALIGGYLNNSNHPIEARMRALYILRAVGTQQVVELITVCLRDRSDFLKQQAVYALGQIKNVSAIHPLHELLSNETVHFMVRREAGVALGTIGTPHCVEILEQYLTVDVPAIIRLACAISKDNIDNPLRTKIRGPLYNTIDPIYRVQEKCTPAHDIKSLKTLLLYEDKDFGVLCARYSVIFDLRDIGTSEAILALCEGLECPNPLIRHAVAFVLGQMCTPLAVHSLVEHLMNSSENELVRVECALALGAIGNLTSKNLLSSCLNDSLKNVRESCLVATDICMRKMDCIDYADPREFIQGGFED